MIDKWSLSCAFSCTFSAGLAFASVVAHTGLRGITRWKGIGFGNLNLLSSVAMGDALWPIDTLSGGVTSLGTFVPRNVTGTMPPKVIAYSRVSTRQQGESGIGLEGQVVAVEAHAQGCAAAIISSYQEIETGKRDDRPELLKVIAELKACGRSLGQIATALNAEGHTTRRGKPWTQVQVRRVLGRDPRQGTLVSG